MLRNERGSIMIIDFIIASVIGSLVALIPIWLGYNITNWQFWLVLPVNFAIGYYWDEIKELIGRMRL